MQDPAFLWGVLILAATAAIVLVTLLACGISRPGSGRAGLVAGALPLALVLPALTTSYASWRLIHAFSGIALSGSGGMQIVLDTCASLWLLQRLAWGAVAALCVCGLGLGLLRFGIQADHAACSLRRAYLLLLLPALGVGITGAVGDQLGRAIRVSAAVVSPTESDSASQQRTDAVLQEVGLRSRGSGSIADTSEFIARALMIGVFGGATAAIGLLGLALSGFILAWRVQFGWWFVACSSALWLLAILGATLVALGVFDPLRMV